MAPGYREIEVRFHKDPDTEFAVGTLAEKNNTLFFEYNSEWISKKLELSPFTLPLQSPLFTHQDHRFGPIFGLFDDSLPDGWGLLLMDRFFRSQNINPAAISILDRLLYLGNNTMGALTYHPSTERTDGSDLLDLHKLATEAINVFGGKSNDILPQLMRAGGSPGGARPKVLIGFNPTTLDMVSGESDIPPGFEHWIVKFSAREDLADAGPVEYAYSKMAVAAGIMMEETKLFSTSNDELFFGVKRFDRRPDNRRLHIHTFGNLIHANFRIPSCDYGDLFKATSILTRNYQDIESVYRLMVFNVLAHNRDDHVKNFSFILDDQTGQWSLAPAYDLTFSRGPGGEHTTTVLGEGMKPTKQLLLQLAEQAGITKPRAEELFKETKEAVSRWPEFAALAGVRKNVIDEVSSFLLDI
ncbi:HipA-like protein [Desulfocapsa sulfexigens DSM 10523]|uniref:HipA-like protein n=1 Tax=Desulfocapsa sulfexigens (strain DSM 10523 / SB164P1) TaxID=1167006 RepID=M1PU91_DESSD|nr:type II toxin-antitoxin system HipA family toxin [Desulfocapsa sulfexigens]AGF79896.1 HipA-like protein [Desulfocapsa sulfexigens DSM 10523]